MAGSSAPRLPFDTWQTAELAVMVGAAMTTQFLLEESPWLPLALLVVAAVIAWARRSSSILVDTLRR